MGGRSLADRRPLSAPIGTGVHLLKHGGPSARRRGVRWSLSWKGRLGSRHRRGPPCRLFFPCERRRRGKSHRNHHRIRLEGPRRRTGQCAPSDDPAEPDRDLLRLGPGPHRARNGTRPPAARPGPCRPPSCRRNPRADPGPETEAPPDEGLSRCRQGRFEPPTRRYRCSGLGKSKRQPASHSARWFPWAGMPPASVIMRARWSRFQVMNVVLRLVKSLSGPPEPGSR